MGREALPHSEAVRGGGGVQPTQHHRVPEPRAGRQGARQTGQWSRGRATPEQQLHGHKATGKVGELGAAQQTQSRSGADRKRPGELAVLNKALLRAQEQLPRCAGGRASPAEPSWAQQRAPQ